MLHMFAMVFKYFSGVFASVSAVFYVASRCSKSKSGVTHRMRVGRARRRGDVSGDTGPLLVRSLSRVRTC
jgi:hypothetical protein